ncbi:MAG: hypothetical protein JXB85_06235 [Anaerolineales bacterium]|nr:hypothetical protein [Anaerolineales bacterium]
MTRLKLTPEQKSVARAPLESRTFLSGPASCGKTTAGVERLHHLLKQGIPGEAILVLTPQRTLQDPYLGLIHSPERDPGGEVTPATVGGLARRMVDLFWPLAGEAAGFTHPDQAPSFLTIETAQYYMAHLVRPLLDQGYFESITIDRNRLYAQILDNLNKSAAIGFPHTEIGTRLDTAWFGDPVQRRVYADAQDCASRFRAYCLEHNLLDFSLQLEVFWEHLWPQEIVRAHLVRTYRHLIYDNVEEDIPRAHDLVRDWTPHFDSTLLIYDQGGGFRRFLGADIETGWSLAELSNRQVVMATSHVASTPIAHLGDALARSIRPDPPAHFGLLTGMADHAEKVPGDELSILQTRFYPELLDAVANETATLIGEARLPPGEIVILAPYLSDALRFALMNRLTARGVPVRSHRPSRSLRDEPATRSLLTLAALAHPAWGLRPTRFDVAHTFTLSLDTDLVRAQLLAEIVYRERDFRLSPFDKIRTEVQQRISYAVGQRYTVLHDWLRDYRRSAPLPLDHFLRRFFGEILSQPGFGFHSNLDSVRVTASLIESIKKFRLALEPVLLEQAGTVDLGREYIATLNDGVIAAQYVQAWRDEDTEAVLVAPAHTFLMMNRPATVQFWLDAGSGGWYERLSQPLTHPYVLSRTWEAEEPGRLWTDADEVQATSDALVRLSAGLLRRCRERLYLGLSELGESGFEQRGELLRSFQLILQTGA